MSPFEALMLICFGLSWPVSISKALRTKKVAGKSPLFMGIVILGYASGMIHKIFYSLDWVIFLYGLNMVMVATDMCLYFYFSRKADALTS